MSQTLTLKLNNPVFTAIRQQAERIGIPPERLAAELLEQKFFQAAGSQLGGTEQAVARSNFKRHFGTLELDSPTDVITKALMQI